MIINFSEEDFYSFVYKIEHTCFESEAVLFPDEMLRVIVPTSDSNINLSFDHKEWSDIQAVMQEAFCMREVYELIKG